MGRTELTRDIGRFGCAGCGGPVPATLTNKPRKWCSERCRKRSYGDPCVDCGAKTRYGAETTRIPEPRCQTCAVEHRRRWTREAIIEAMRAWAKEYGEPPAAADWNPYLSEHRLHDVSRAERFRAANGRWPGHMTVFTVFGSWSEAIAAAGFEPRPMYGGGPNALRLRSVRGRAGRR